MPTLIERPSRLIPVLLIVLAAQAQDLHIKKNITVGGYPVSSSDTSVKGARERTVSQTPSGNSITLRQCDLKRTVTINEQTQTYFIAKDAQDDAATKTAATGTPKAASGAYITETSTVTDTGERKTLYGYTARHLKTKVTVQSSANACTPINEQYEIDGWYADLSKDIGACQQVLRPVGQSEACHDPVVRHHSGSAKAGYPLNETITLHNADGSATEVGIRADEISKQPLEKELFDIPAGYREVKTLAELNSGPAPHAVQAPMTASAQPSQQPMNQQQMMQQGQQNSAMAKSSMSNMMNNPAGQAAYQQQQMAMAQQAMSQTGGAGKMGPGGSMMPGGGMQGMPGAQAPAPAPVGPKQPGKIRIGVAPPDAQVGQGNNTGGDYSTPIRNAEITLMSGPAIDVVPLDAHIAMQLQAEAQQKQCDYIMYSAVSVKHPQAAGFGKFAKFGSMAASMTPMGMMAHGMAGAAAAQAAGMAASQMAQQQAMNQLANFNGQIKSKDDVAIQYQLVASGQTAPVLQNTLQGKAKSDGEDVLTPLLQQTATAVLTQVSQPAHK